MTAHRDFKNIVRERQAKTGESYTAARRHVLRARAEMLGEPVDAITPSLTSRPETFDAVVLKVNGRSARVRFFGEAGEVTFKSGHACELIPGHVATLVPSKRWTWRGDAYASGNVERSRLDLAALDLDPLPLRGGDLLDAREVYERVRAPDPYAPLWRKLTARPKPSFEFDAIAWGPRSDDLDEHPVSDAAELTAAGDEDGATLLLMDVLHRDLRCIDAHVHLGNIAFERNPKRALLHYEVGIAIGELSLPRGYDGFLPWGCLYNRPFLRSLHGAALCHWRLARALEAQMLFERILALNPNDNQGARFCWNDVREGRTWEEAQERDATAEAGRRDVLH